MIRSLARTVANGLKRLLTRTSVRARALATKISISLTLLRTRVHIRALNLRYRIVAGIRRQGSRLLVATLTLLLVSILLFHPQIESAAQSVISAERVTALQNALLNVGAQLVGISALVFALVTFALQANLERMPYTLFARLTADRSLLLYFATIFALCIFIACLSLVITKANAGSMALLALWGLTTILIMIFMSFRRALLLISPAHQLSRILSSTRKDFDRWNWRAKLYEPLMPANPPAANLDGKRIAFFALHPLWTVEAQRALQHAAAYVRHYASIGDIEVSAAAITVMVQINRQYVQVKGKTFFGNNPLLDHGLSTDNVLNLTLEQLRQLSEHGLQSNNEALAEQAMGGMAALVPVYNLVDYGALAIVKTHANLALGYLESAIKAAIPKNMPDIVMQGVRLLGNVGQQFVVAKAPTEVASVAENLAQIGLAGVLRESYRPVVQTTMYQQADLTLALLQSEVDDIRFAAGAILDGVKLVSLAFLQVPGNQPISIHSTYLGPYHSMTVVNGFASRLTDLGNALINADAGNANAARIARNLEVWSDNLHRYHRDIFVAAVNARSPLVLDLAHSTTQIARVLLGVADAEATPAHTRGELVEHAEWLASTLTWVPDNADAVQFAENYSLTDTLIDFALQVAQSEHETVWQTAVDILRGWAFKTAKHGSRLHTPEKCLAAIAAIMTLRELEHLPADVAAKIRRHKPPGQELPVARLQEIVGRTVEQYIDQQPDRFALDRLLHVLQQIDRPRFRVLLQEVLAAFGPQAQPGGNPTP